MPISANDNILNAGETSSRAPGTTIWMDELDKWVEKRRDAEKKLLDLSKNNATALAAYEEELEAERLNDLLETKKRLIKQLAKIEKDLGGLTEKDRAALKKKYAKEQEKEEKKKQQLSKNEVAYAKGMEVTENLKNIFSGEGSFIENLKAAGSNIAEVLKNSKDEWGDALGEAAKKSVGKFMGAATQSVNNAMTTLQGVYSKISARLLSSGESFESINNTMRLLLAASPFVKYTDMLGKVDELVSSGVAYNVEQRAFLASISDKIASTFDAFDSNLLRIIRIQLEDSTKLRLGMEARLTEFLNSRYRDTSYLSGAHDSVTEALTASIVLLGTARGAEFEYNVQKWFGSLGALGISDNALTGLAGAINSLATGDVEALAGSEYMNLIAIAANKSGLPIGDIFSKGLNEDNVNDLIRAIVNYWATIANETNQVVKNQYGKIFGLDMTDMVAIRNITDEDLKSISRESLTYLGMRSELTSQLLLIPGRMHASEMLSNVWDNFMIGMGLNIASSPSKAAMWLINDLIKDASGGINIPSIGALAMGTGLANLDLETDVNSLIQLGMVGMSTLKQVGKVVGGMAGLGGLNLAFWGAEQYNTRGGGIKPTVTGVTASTSQTVYIGNSSSSDIYDQTLNKAYDDAGVNEIKSQTEDAAEKAKELMDNIESDVHQIMEYLRDVFTGSALRVRVEDYGLSGGFGV